MRLPLTGGLREPYAVPGTEPGSAVCKARPLATVLPLWPLLPTANYSVYLVLKTGSPVRSMRVAY